MWHFNYWYKLQVAHCILQLSNRTVRVFETSEASWGYGETVWCCLCVCRQCGICFESCLLHTKLCHFLTFFKLWYGMILKSFLLITFLGTGTHFSKLLSGPVFGMKQSMPDLVVKMVERSIIKLFREKMTFLEFLSKKKLGNVNSAYTCVILFLNGDETTLNGLRYYFYLSTFLFLQCLFGSLSSMSITFTVLFGMLNGRNQNQAPNSGIYLWLVS